MNEIIKHIQQEKQLLLTLLFWVGAGMFTGPLAMGIIPLHILYLKKNGDPLIFLLGLWFILTLSDSRQAIFQFAQQVKPIVISILALIIFTEGKKSRLVQFQKPFIIFFIIASFCILDSVNALTSIQKTASYFLMLFIVPNLVIFLLEKQKERFFKGVVFLGLLILGIGLAIRFVLPGMVYFAGRFTGLLGNPNGLGLFCFCFLMLFTIIQKHYPYLFSNTTKYIIYGVIIISLIMAGSRGGIFASLLFLFGAYMFRISRMWGIITMAVLIISYQLIINNIEDIIISLNLQDYFRIETLKTGSGRLVAIEFAWKEIQKNYWRGRGFGFTENLMWINRHHFENLGHDGNVHNSYLTIWLDTGLAGLLAFMGGWITHFLRANKFSYFAGAVFFAILFSGSVESWLAASLNPFTIQLVIILTLLSSPKFYD